MKSEKSNIGEFSGYVGFAPDRYWEALYKANEIVSKVDKSKYIVAVRRGKHPIIEGHEAIFYKAIRIRQTEEPGFKWFAECCPTFYKLWHDLKKTFR